MLSQKFIDIHLRLPATENKSAGKHVVFVMAEPKIDLTPHPGASYSLFVVLLDHGMYPPVHSQG
jgi:hypothetical protein